MNDLHGKIISYDNFTKLKINRLQYLDKKLYDEVSDNIKKNKQLLFLPTTIYETHMQDEKYTPSVYKIVLKGILKDGRCCQVIINEIDPYFDVIVPNDVDINTFNVDLTMALAEDPAYVCYKKSVFNSKTFKYYQKDKTRFIRLYYKKVFKGASKDQGNRLSAIKHLQSKGYLTASDDLSNYVKVVARDKLITLSSWVTLDDYRIVYDHANLKGMVINVHINNYKTYTGKLDSVLLIDNTMSVAYDLETSSVTGDVPQPENADDHIRCLGCTFQWVNIIQPFLQVVFCDLPAKANSKFLTVVCGNEFNIIEGFSMLFESLSPEFILGFNDSDYDWKWIVHRASHNPGILSNIAHRMDSVIPYRSYTDEDILKYKFKKETIKLEADTSVDGYSLMLTGYIPIDVRSMFRRLYPTAENSSLKWFLSKNKLGSKEDMPYETLHRIYKELSEMASQYKFKNNDIDLDISDKEILEKYNKLIAENTEANAYCVVDALRCHELMNIKSVIMDYREVSKLAHVSLYDSIYRANGMKVSNLIISVGQQAPFSYRFTSRHNHEIEEGKFPGALVLPPKKGLVISKLSIDERIEKANLLKNKEVVDSDLSNWVNVDEKTKEVWYDFIEKYGCDHNIDEFNKIIESIESEKNNLSEKIKYLKDKRFVEFITEKQGRPITGLDYSSLYPSVMRAYNLSPEKCILDRNKAMEIAATGQRITTVNFMYNNRERIGYFVWHNNQYDTHVIIDGKKVINENFGFGLFPYILNDLFNKRALLKKELEKIKDEVEIIEQKESKSPGYIDKNCKEKYEDLVFQKAYLNSKQNALKVFMNTFYGEVGNKLSSFYLVEIAGGTTLYGKKNLQLACDFVKNKGCGVYYGDTDSLYITMPKKSFNEVDRLYYTNKINKIDYWTKMVEITFVEINKIKTGVNEMLMADNGTKFLSMAYEEVLFPVAFTAKKKYYGVPHEKLINFSPKELFIRGLEVKKRGVSKILKIVFDEIMRTSIKPDNKLTLLELVHDKIDEIYKRKWALEDFIQTGVYKPNKKNVKMHTYVERMKDLGIIVKPYERFDYLLVKKYPYKYDLRGRKVDLQIGDRIEQIETVRDNNLEIDIDYYMQGSINGQLARLIAYHDKFHVDDEDIAVAEKKIYDLACKYIENYCESYYTKYNTFNKALQNIYKESNKIIGNSIKNKDKDLGKLLMMNADFDDIESWILTNTNKEAVKICKDYGKKFVNHYIDAYIKEKTIVVKNKDDEDDSNKNIKNNKGDSNKDDKDDITKDDINKDDINKDDINKDDKNKDVEDESNKDNKDNKDDGDFIDYDNYNKKVADKKSNKKVNKKQSNKIDKNLNKLKKEAIISLQKSYYSGNDSLLKRREGVYNETLSILKTRLRELSTDIVKLYKLYNLNIEDIINKIKDNLKLSENMTTPVDKNNKPSNYKIEDLTDNDIIDNKIVDNTNELVDKLFNNKSFVEISQKYKKLYNDILSINIMINRVNSIVDYLKTKQEIKSEPSIKELSNIIDTSIKTSMDTQYNL